MDDETSDWVRHPFTEKSAKLMAKKADELRTTLMAECRRSSDPKVVAAITELDGVSLMVMYFRGGTK